MDTLEFLLKEYWVRVQQGNRKYVSMAKRRKVIPISLTPEQRKRLERLWFYYGNYGPESTPGNHSFIQRLLEQGYDERPLINSRTRKSMIPTPDCVAAVEAVLALKNDSGAGDEQTGAVGLRLISSAEERSRPEAEPELKAILDDMHRRYAVMRARLEGVDDTPDAA